MALTRKWIGSPNFSSRGGSAVRVIALHTTEGAQDITSLGNYFKNSSVQASSHVGADNNSKTTIGEYVARGNKAWTQANANPYCISCEICTPSGAAAGWSRSTWLGKETMLRAVAAWVAEEARYYGIPIVALSASQAQGGGKGICQHRDFGSMGGNHNDCGNGFPMDKIIEWAKGGGGSAASPAPGPVESDMTAAVAYYKGDPHFACIWSDGKVNYRAPGGSWYAVDPNSSARSGCDLAIDPGSGRMIITYINGKGEVCSYDKGPGGNSWQWANRGGKAK